MTGLCEINLDGVAKRLVKADKYNMSISINIVSQTVEKSVGIYTKFNEHIKGIISSETADFKIKAGNLKVVRNKEDIKKFVFINTTNEVAMVTGNVSIEVKAVNNIVGRIIALCDQYMSKAEKGTTLTITHYGSWDFSDELIDETKIDLMTEAYDNARSKIEKLMKSGKIDSDSVHGVKSKFKVVQIGEAKVQSNITRSYGASFDYCEDDCEIDSFDDKFGGIDTSEVLKLPDNDIPETLVSISIPMKFIEKSE